jgi:hypothetical protein
VTFEAQLPSGNDPERLTEARGLGWNWGGFLLPYWWLVGHGRPGVGFLLLVSVTIPFVSLIHLLLYPLACIYLGLNGYEMAWKHSPYHSVEQLREREVIWGWWGLAGVLLFMVFALMILAFWASLTAGLREALQGLPG